MNSSNTNPALQDLARELHETFVANHWAHAEQLADGSYNTLYKPLGIARIQSLLRNGESCLTYQLTSGALRWVCFDVDIKRETLIREDYATLKNEAQMEVIEVISLLCAYLAAVKLPYLLEFSGNRGAHVWVVWKEFVDQRYGYALQQKLLESSQALKACRLTAIDRFPQTPQSKGQLGKGVKLPLSKHRKSGFYSCLVTGPQALEKRFSAPFAELDSEMVSEQSEILKSFVVPDWSEIASIFGLDAKAIGDTALSPAYIRQTIKLTPEHVPTLDTVLNNLSGCALLRPLIERCRANELLSEKERAILVGLLRSLQLAEKKDFGKELLLELFSRQPNFKPNVTAAKLSNLNLYPPTCSYLSQTFALKQEACETHTSCEVQKSPIELLENCKIEEVALFDLTPEQFEVIRAASSRYAQINDEIDLRFLRLGIQRIDTDAALDSFPTYLSQQRNLGPHYIFERPESGDRVRTLVSLGAYDAVLSAWFTKILDGLFGTEVSPNSYGFRFEPSLYNSNLFKPWLPQWLKYTKALSRIIEDGAFDDYWVVKLDIRSFYDQISLTRLRVKLGTGPSRACGRTLQSLDQESRGRYETICSTLVEWCRAIGGGDRGVPQGPAFARYLAELYLLQFDQDVETLILTHQARYFRWVDDVFLIAPHQASAQAIDRVIRGEIEALSLEVSEEKAFLGTVRDYRQRFCEYKNDSKYFVDQVSRKSRTTSTSLNAQAREVLNDMITGPNGVGLKPENASFILTHLRTSPQTVAHFLPELLKVEIGRGSFFKHLFDYIAKDLKGCEFNPEKWNLSGLVGFRLEVFLNSLLWTVNEGPLSPLALDNLSKILRSLECNAKSRLARSLIIHLMLSDPMLFKGTESSHDVSVNDLIQCLDQRQDLEIVDNALDGVLEQLTGIPISEAIKVLHMVTLDHRLSKAGYQRSADRFFALILEQLEQGHEAAATLPCLTESQIGNGELLRKYHMLCCLCFVTASAKNLEEFKRVWLALIVPVNQLRIWRPGKAYWLEKVDSVEINHTNLSVLFAAGLGGDGVCPGQADQHNVFDEYHYHLVVFLFAFSKQELVESLPSKNELLAEANRQGMLYLEWLLEPNSRVFLYPNKKVCLRNIVENDLTILKRANEVLVRYPKSREFTTAPSAPAIIVSKVETSQIPFINYVSEFPADSIELDRLIRDSADLATVIGLVIRIFKNLRQFSHEYAANTRGVPNVFIEGFGLRTTTLASLIPATALGPKLLVSAGPVIQSKTNNSATAWGLLIEKIESSNRNLLGYNHYAQVSAANIRTLMPPQMEADEQVAFLECFYDALPKHMHPTPFEIDRAKLESAARYSKAIVDQQAHSTERRVPTLFGKAVEVYLFITGEQSEFGKRMSFSPIRSPSDKSLGRLLDALLKSLEWTNQHAYLGNGGIKFLESIRLEFLSLKALVDTLIEVGEKDVDPIAVLDGAKRSVVEQGNDYELIVDGAELISASGQVVAQTTFTVCRFGGYSLVEEPLSALHSAELRRSLVYSAKGGSKTVLFLTDDIVRTVFEMIRKRSEVFFVTGLNATNAALFECLEDRSAISESLKGSPYFTAACAAIRCNHFTSEQIQGVDDCGRFLLRWLEQFDVASAEVLLEVIAAHQCVTESHIEQFVSNVSLHKAKAIVFSTKKLADHGGVHRLFTLTQQGQEIIRSLELDSAVSKIANFKGGDETLVVLAETILSSGQLVNNFKWHYLSENKRNGVYIEQQRLFEIEDFKIDFVQGLKRFNKILILSAAFTQRGAERLREYLSTTLGISLECIEVKGATLEDSACFLAESEDISVASKNALKSLVSNMEHIISIFQVEDEAAYARSLRKIDDANLIVRPNSVTKKGLKIFTLPPLNKNIPPLFRETKEHE